MEDKLREDHIRHMLRERSPIRIKLARLGLCMGAILFLNLYTVTAVQIGLNFYLPVGLLMMSAYTWLVVRLKGIYPQASRAVGQLCLTFLLIVVGITASYGASAGNIPSSAHIASMMFLGLFFLYIFLKRKT